MIEKKGTKIVKIKFTKSVNTGNYLDECDFCERQLRSRVAWEFDYHSRLIIACNFCMKELRKDAKK